MPKRSKHTSASATARVDFVDTVMEVDYTGSITNTGFVDLDFSTMPMRLAAPATLERMDKALTMVNEAQGRRRVWSKDTPPSAVIVREDQYEQAEAFSRHLAKHGIVRVTFLQSQSEQARQFVERVSEDRRLRSRPTPLSDTPPLSPDPREENQTGPAEDDQSRFPPLP